jgi:hypothetical protein
MRYLKDIFLETKKLIMENRRTRFKIKIQQMLAVALLGILQNYLASRTEIHQKRFY